MKASDNASQALATSEVSIPRAIRWLWYTFIGVIGLAMHVAVAVGVLAAVAGDTATAIASVIGGLALTVLGACLVRWAP
jgi:hypothetical protein